MRDLVAGFATEAAAALAFTSPIVELGARPAAGQEDLLDLRTQFPRLEFIGCDIQAGPRVDRIEDIHHLSFEDESVGGVFALDTLEHVADPHRALQEVWRVLRPGGVVVISSVMFFPIHAHPWDYWRFTPEGFELLLAPFESRLVMAHGWSEMPDTVFGIGVKGPAPQLSEALFPVTAARSRQWAAHLPVDFGPIRMTTRDLWRHTMKATVSAVARRMHRS